MFKKRYAAASVFGTILFATALGTCVLGPVSMAHAGLLDVRVDLGNGAGAAPVNWNQVTAAGTSYELKDFNDFTGATVATLTYSVFALSGQNQSGLSWSNDQATWVDSEGIKALSDYIVAYQSNNPGQIIIGGLDPNELYNLELLSVRGHSTGASYWVNGVAGEAVFPTGSSSTASTESWSSGTDGLTNQGFMQWTNVAPNVSGQIVIDADANGTYAFFNGLRLSQVPEPGTWVLLTAGLLAILARRRRHE